MLSLESSECSHSTTVAHHESAMAIPPDVAMPDVPYLCGVINNRIYARPLLEEEQETACCDDAQVFGLQQCAKTST